MPASACIEKPMRGQFIRGFGPGGIFVESVGKEKGFRFLNRKPFLIAVKTIN
jgi:hypothetical protein